MKTQILALSAASLVAQILLSQSLSALASERMDTLGKSIHSDGVTLGVNSINPSWDDAKNGSKRELGSMAIQFASKLGILQKLERLQAIRGQSSEANYSQEVLGLKQDLLESTVIAAEELRTVVARVNSEIADSSELHAHLAERRDRAVRLNTYANLISGGITGIVGGAMQIADPPINHIAPDLVDLTEGVIQSSLASWALAQQRGEKRMTRKTPSLLNHMMNKSTELQSDYPESVWVYLNLPCRDGKETICSSLIDRWFKLNLCLRHKGHRESRASRMVRLSNMPDGSQRVTIDVLEDRMAMLSDLRASVQQMDYLILELMQCIHGTRNLPQSH